MNNQEPEKVINTETLVVKKTTNYLEATGINEKILQDAHKKFINIMNQECGIKNSCSAIGFKKYLESLSVLEQKAVLFYAMCELNAATHELSQRMEKDKKIILPPKKIKKP
jgi:hypothetical protein